MNSSLANIVGFLDSTRKITSITTDGATWVATEDCILTGYVDCEVVGTYSQLFVNDIIVAISGCGGATASYPSSVGVFIPVKKGQVVRTRSGDGFVYGIDVYAMQR